MYHQVDVTKEGASEVDTTRTARGGAEKTALRLLREGSLGGSLHDIRRFRAHVIALSGEKENETETYLKTQHPKEFYIGCETRGC